MLEVEFKDAKDAPWFVLARLIAHAIETASGREAVAGVWTLATRATGLSVQILKRYVALWGRMRTIAAEMEVPLEELLSPVFNAQETAARVYARSKKEGADVMRRLAAGDITLARVRELQSRLARIAEKPAGGAVTHGPRSIIFHKRTVNAYAVVRAFKESLVDLWGVGAHVERRSRLRYGATGYEVIGGDGSVKAGFEVMFPDANLKRDYVEDHIGDALLLSTFFPEYFLAFAADADPEVVTRTAELLDWFEYRSVGVATCDPDGRLTVVRKPTAPPVPDRTAKYEALKRKYRVTRGGASGDS